MRLTELEMSPKEGVDPDGGGHGKLSFMLFRILRVLKVRKMPGFRRATQ